MVLSISELIMTVGGGAIAVLLSVVAYFLRSLHMQLQQLDKDMQTTSTQLAVLIERQNNGANEIHARLKALEVRMSKLEEQ